MKMLTAAMLGLDRYIQSCLGGGAKSVAIWLSGGTLPMKNIQNDSGLSTLVKAHEYYHKGFALLLLQFKSLHTSWNPVPGKNSLEK